MRCLKHIQFQVRLLALGVPRSRHCPQLEVREETVTTTWEQNHFRKIMLNSSSCAELTSKDNYLSSRYFPRWRWSAVFDFLVDTENITRSPTSPVLDEEVGRQLQDTEVFPDKKGYFHMNVARMKELEISKELKYEFHPRNNSVLNVTNSLIRKFTDRSTSHHKHGGQKLEAVSEQDRSQAASAVTWLLTRQILKHQAGHNLRLPSDRGGFLLQNHKNTSWNRSLQSHQER